MVDGKGQSVGKGISTHVDCCVIHYRNLIEQKQSPWIVGETNWSANLPFDVVRQWPIVRVDARRRAVTTAQLIYGTAHIIFQTR